MSLNEQISVEADFPLGHSDVIQWLRSGFLRFDKQVAVSCADRTLSFAEVDRLSNQVAHYLAGLGVVNGDHVGLGLNRSPEMIVVLIGILKAGAAYVPLDPGYPIRRLQKMCSDAELELLFVNDGHADLFASYDGAVLVWEQVAAQIASELDSALPITICPESPCYIIFTSGSTGRPKGIVMPHRALANLIEWQLSRCSFKYGARVLQYSSISFDVSFQEIATTLASGGTLFLIPDEERRDSRRLLTRLNDYHIQRLFLPYVAMRSLIEAAHIQKTYPCSLKEVITAGEPLRVDHVTRTFFSEIEGASLDNQYGPSETHVITANLLEGDSGCWPDLPSIGLPIKKNEVFILDENMRPVDKGEVGELYLAGSNLALGYLGSKDSTAKAFLSNPFSDIEGGVVYKTGDLGRFNENGSINLVGRKDHQVKIRGHRVELDEINVVVARYPGIIHSVSHCLTGASVYSSKVVTYYQVQQEHHVDNALLRQYLSSTLPDYMVPSFLIEIDTIPYTPSGKIDFKTLPVPEFAAGGASEDDCLYETGTESVLSKIWSEVLGVGAIPRTVDFFELGGNSLSAVSLFLKIEKQFGCALPLSSLAESGTIEKLARVIDRGSAGGFLSLEILQTGDAEKVPLVLIHGGAGNVLVFKKMIKFLDSSTPVFGFQWSGWSGGKGERSIARMARMYTEELLRHRPDLKTVKIGGYCIGGLIAIELADQLKIHGIVVEGPLLVFDSPNLHSKKYRHSEPWDVPAEMVEFEQLKATMIKQAVPSAGAEVFGAPETVSGGITGLLKRIPGIHPLVCLLKYLRMAVPVRIAWLSRRPVPMGLRPVYCLRTMLAAVRDYESAGYDGDTIYFRSYSVLGRGLGIPGWWNDPFMGFAEICSGNFKGYIVGGQHHDLLEMPELGKLVSQLVSSGDIYKQPL